jgi:hypothetical protein
MSDGGKGSSPRPFSIGAETYASNWDRIFNKNKEQTMQVRVKENTEDIGKCGCGRSPTGKCIGWHGLSEEMYQHRKMLWMEDEFRRDAEESNKTE